MSGLKAFKFLARDEINSDASIGNFYYLKSEADKEIASYKKLADDCELGMHLIQAIADKFIAHSNYKRCLAMANWCDAEADVADADGDYDDMRWYQKWHNRCLELADKFKETDK